MVAGRGLAGVLRKHYPRWLVLGTIVLLCIANTINTGTDIGAIAATINLLVARLSPLLLVAPIAVVIVAVQVLGSYNLMVRIFKQLTLTLFGYNHRGLRGSAALAGSIERHLHSDGAI